MQYYTNAMDKLSWNLNYSSEIQDPFGRKDFSGNRLPIALCVGATAYILIQAFYNLYLHPLASFPGPFLARSSLVSVEDLAHLCGANTSINRRTTQEIWWETVHSPQHRRDDKLTILPGRVFRVSPNELSFSSVTSWKAIYGHASTGKQPVKSKFYDMYGSAFNSSCIGSERDPKKHSGMKRNLAVAFSTQALLEQEDVIQGCIDGFIEKIGSMQQSTKKGLNMTHWFEMISFDVLGEMAFGESFHAVQDGKRHFWSEMLTSHLFFITMLDNMSRYPFFVTLGRWILPWATTSVRDKHSGFTRTKVQKRLDTESTRKDFLTTLVTKVKSGEVDKEEMTAHVSTLVIAGGETSSSFLAATTYHLLQTPEVYKKFKDEIRTTFSSYEDITSASAQRVPYLQAVIAEGLRMFPPGSQGFPRLSPGMYVDDHWVPEGTEIYTSAWSVTHDASYFHDPFSFQPDRWIDRDCKDVKEASQPFSLGPRGCLGRNFAYVEISLILAKMHFTYDLELVDKRLDWEGQSHLHVNWWKPDLFVRFLPRV